MTIENGNIIFRSQHTSSDSGHFEKRVAKKNTSISPSASIKTINSFKSTKLRQESASEGENAYRKKQG